MKLKTLAIPKMERKIKNNGWVYEDKNLGVCEFVCAVNERAARSYFKDLIWANYPRNTYNPKCVRKYSSHEKQ